MNLDMPHPKLQQRHRAEFDACDRLLQFARGRFETWAGRPLEGGTADIILAAEGAKATKTYRAALLLAAAGFGQQAMMLGRSLFEAVLVTHWAAERSDRAFELFTKHGRHTRLLTEDRFRELGWSDGPPLQPASPEEREHLDGLFGEWGEKHWTRKSSYQLMKAVQHQWDDGGQDLRSTYKVGLKDSNLMLHSSAWSLERSITEHDEENVSFESGPSRNYIGQALLFATWSYGQIVSLLIKHFEMPGQGEFDEVFAAAIEAFRADEKAD